jgi:hypothetical protein
LAKKRVFISFDYDYDSGAKHMLAGQAKLPDSPFDFVDASVKEHLTGDWKEKVRKKMQRVDLVLVLCGERTDKAVGVTAEVKIAKECDKRVIYIGAYSDKKCVLPDGAGWFDTMHGWTWDNLKKQIG